MQVWYMRTIGASYRADFCVLLFFDYFARLLRNTALISQPGLCMLFTCQGAIGDSCRVVVLLCMLPLYAHSRKCQPIHYKNIAQKSAADFMQINETDILIYIVCNSWTMAMPVWGRRSPVAPFLCQDVFLYAWSFYSVIHILYSFNIHCFNGK